MVTRQALHDFAETFGKKFRGRHLYVGASEVGLCLRKIFYAKHQKDKVVGVLPDSDYEESWGATHRGSVFEEAFWVPAMQARYGKNMLYSGSKQKRWKVGNLSGAPDGLLVQQPRNALAHLFVPDIGSSGEIVLDCKTIDPRARYHLNKARTEHVVQINTNMGLMRESGPHKPDFGIISYVNASFFDDIVEFPVKFDARIYANAKVRAERILAATEAKDCRPEGWIAGGRECEYCAWARACAAVRGSVPAETKEKPPLDRQLAAELSDLAREQQLAADAAKEATSRRRELEEQIKERLREKGLRVVTTNGTRIVWSSVRGRTTLNLARVRDACAKAGIDLSQFENVGDPSDRLTVSVAAPMDE